MALEQGALTIVEKADGSAHIVDQYGRITQRVSGKNAVGALKDAYGSRIGTVLNNTTGASTVINEPKETPRIEVDESQLKEVPMMHVEYQRDSEGNIVKGADGKNIVTSFGVKYADGTISYTGAGREGVLEAERQRSSAKQYNDFITDGRTREDFASDEEYNNFKTVKNIRIGQGSYTRVTDKTGQTTLYAPSGKELATGDEDTIRKEYQAKSNQLFLAITKAESTPKYTPFGIRYMMEQGGYENETAVYRELYEGFNARKDDLKAIVNSWGDTSDDRMSDRYINNILNPITDMQYRSPEEEFLRFRQQYTVEDDPKYGDYSAWYNENIKDIKLPNTNVTQPDTQPDIGTGPVTQPVLDTPVVEDDVGVTPPPADTGTGTDIPSLEDLDPVIEIPTPPTPTPETPPVVTPDPTPKPPPTNFDPFSGTFTYTGTPADQVAGGVFTMGQTPPQTTTTTPVGGTGISQPQGTTEVRAYRNAAGLTANITFVNGQPQTSIPAGFYPITAQPKTAVDMSSTQVGGNTGTFTMAKGGIVYADKGTLVAEEGMQVMASQGTLPDSSIPEGKTETTELGIGYVPQMPEVAKDDPDTPEKNEAAGITDIVQYQATTPGLPEGAAVSPAGIKQTEGQFIDPESGQVGDDLTTTTLGASTTMAQLPDTDKKAEQVTAAQVTPAIKTAVEATEAATLNPEDSKAQITAAEATSSSVSDLEAATGSHIKMENPVTREIMDGELISGAADAEKAAKFTEAIDHAEATPSKQATVAGQLEGLMQDFEGGETPPWAAGAMRTAMQSLAARGLGASSMAGQAVIQAAMEASLPIAQADAATVAQFEFKNLSNKQERKMLAAQQRAQFMGQEFDQEFQSRVFNATKIGEVANLNFTADQQVALENSRAANTMALANLNNEQALVMAEAAALSQLDLANLDNKQQAAVQNAQNFLAIEMANLSNKQQTELFKTQQITNGLLSDQAATNAAEQFNASSQNQLDQVMAGLAADVSKFNANQANAQAQFNAGEANAMEKFTTEINNQREQFNATNRLVIDQNNAQWRREIAKTDTAAVNRANEINATNVLGMNQQAMNNLWNYYSDSMSWAWTSAENERERTVNLAIEQLKVDSSKDIESMRKDYSSSANFGALIGKVMTTDLDGSFLGDAFDFLTGG